MKKKTYEQPACRVVLLQHKTMLLAGSPNPPEWAGEGGSREDEWDFTE